MIWSYEIENNEFNAEKYLPLCNIDPQALPVTFDTPYPIDIDIDYYYYSDIYHSDNYVNIKVTGSIVGLTTGARSSPYYPCVYLYLGDTYTGGYCGVMVRSGNYDTRSTLTVTINDVESEVKTNDINTGDTFVGENTSNNPYIVVHHCTLPILLSSYMGENIDFPTFCSEYMWFNEGYYDDAPVEIKENAWNYYNPLTTPHLTAEQLSKVMNIAEEIDVIPRDYIYVSRGVKGTWDEFGQFTPDPTADILYKGFKVRFNNDAVGKLALYPIPYEDGDTDLKWGIKMSDTPDAVYYCYDNGETWQMPISPALPFTWIWRTRENEVGTFYSNYGGYGNENVPIFADEDTAYDYITGNGVSIKDAINYDKISNKYPIQNDTCEQDDATIFGEVYTRAFFSQQYIVSATVMTEIANALYDTDSGGITGLWDDIKKGLEMYGDSPIQCIQNACFVPFDATQVFTNLDPRNYIYFGGYRLTLNSGNASRLVYPNGKFDFGDFEIKPTFKSFRDFEPYTKLYVYLAYIGWYQLDIKKYMGKTVNVTYYFDTRTNTTCAVLTANGVMTDFFNGQMGVNFPVTANDYTAFANAQIQTLMGFNKGGAELGGMAGSFSKGVGAGLVESGLMSAGGVALGLGGVGLAVNGAKTLYGLTQNNINNFTKTIGGSSSMINMYLPQEVCFMFEIQDAMPTDYEQELIGLPSNASGYVGSFSGYLECEQVNLVCSGATANEQSEIIHALYSGVYI